MIFEQTLEETIFIQGIVNKQDWSNGKKEWGSRGDNAIKIIWVELMNIYIPGYIYGLRNA